MTTEEKRPEDREVETIFGWCTTGECEKCIVWSRWTHCIYVCSHDCHKGKERPPLPPLDPPWDAQPKGAARKKKAPQKKTEPSTNEPQEGMIEEPVQEDGTGTGEEEV